MGSQCNAGNQTRSTWPQTEHLIKFQTSRYQPMQICGGLKPWDLHAMRGTRFAPRGPKRKSFFQTSRYQPVKVCEGGLKPWSSKSHTEFKLKPSCIAGNQIRSTWSQTEHLTRNLQSH